jgi:uncharacterized protein
LNDDWGVFLKRHGFLVGVSVDGPRELHDRYRVTRGGKGTFDLVMRGVACLRRHGVDYNVLCTVNAANQHHGRRVYAFFRDELGADWIQFIPIVERATEDTVPLANLGWSDLSGQARILYTQTGTVVTNRSVGGRQYGQFLIDVFEEWVRRDVGMVFVQMFDVTLDAYFGRYTLCIHAPTCGLGPALEHNGDMYACDHYVEPDYFLGNIHQTHMLDLVASPKQRKFGQDKLDTLTSQCENCEFRPLCNGGCPKDRFADSRDGEAGHNYLCAGLELFYRHTRPAMEKMVALLREGRPAAHVMEWVMVMDAKRGRDSLCPCRGGRRFRRCHGGAPAREAVGGPRRTTGRGILNPLGEG